MRAWLCALVLAAGLTPALRAAAPDPELQRLIERIARGEDADGAAADALIDRVTGPLEAALKDLDRRPFEEQARVQAALSRIRAVLRARVWRLSLPPDDRALYDEFVRKQPRLVDQLFDDNADTRHAALDRITLDPNTGAGVMIAARVDDWEPDVIDRAFDIAEELGDAVVIRNLVRQVQSWMHALRSGMWKGEELATYRVVIGPLVGRAARIIGRGHDPNAVPALLDALEYYGRPDNRSEIIELGGLVGALGRLGDERAAPALVQLIRDDVPVRQVVRQGPAVTVTVQTLGDLALLALTHIYKLDPAALGYEGGADLWEGGSFPSPAARARALRLFKDWYAANAEKPAAARQPLPTTQPAEPAGP